MFNFGDIARATKLFQSSDIDELMAEPPVVGAARKRNEEIAVVPRLFRASETVTAEPRAMAERAPSARDHAHSEGEQGPAPRRIQAAA